MVNILVAFSSRTGATAKLASAVGTGASSVGAFVRLRQVADSSNHASAFEVPTPEDARWADGILFGTPSRFGNASAELKAYIESLEDLWKAGALNGKIGGAFCRASTAHGGIETTLLALYAPLAHLGLIIVPTGYADPASSRMGSPYGATSVIRNTSAVPLEDELELAAFQGRRTALVASALRRHERRELGAWRW